MSQPSGQSDFFRIVNIFVLVYIAVVLTDYAPLVPRAVTFMDDVHTLRQKSDGWEVIATDIQKSLKSFEKILDFFQAEVDNPTDRAWVENYIRTQKGEMSAEQSRTGRRPPLNRVKIHSDVTRQFGDGGNRLGGIMTWIRILYWIAVIVAAL